MPKMKKSAALYNFDNARKSPWCVVVEGPLDVCRFGPEAVSLFGRTAAPKQLGLIRHTWDTVVVLLDGDSPELNEELCSDLKLAGCRTIPVMLPKDKDPGDLATEYLRSLVFRAAQQEGVDLLSLSPRKVTVPAGKLQRGRLSSVE
jgi:DNA primase